MGETNHSILSSDLNSSGNRRLVTIMFSDISGYTHLMDHDEKNALETVQQSLEIHQKYLTRFNGRLVKELGDGFLCIFDSPSDAVSCAKALIQSSRTLPDLNLHIGIHQGEVVFTDNDIYGAGVNIASRIDAESKPNEILVSEEVWENIKNKPEFKGSFIGVKNLKNVDHPLKIYHVHLDNEKHFSKISLLLRNKKGLKRLLTIILSLATVLLLIYFEYIPFSSEIKEKPYVAVIPFRNEDPDIETAYLGQSLAEDVIAQLFSSQEISVLSANSSFKFQHEETSSKEIAKRLNADLVLFGQYTVVDNIIRLRVELVDGKTDEIVSFSTLSSAMPDINTLAIDIRHNLYESLNIEDVNEVIKTEKKLNLQAYRYHALGRSMMRDNRQQSRDSIISLFELAIQYDPTYIDAYLGIVQAYAFDASRGRISFPEAAKNIRPYLVKAQGLSGQTDKVQGFFGILHFLEFKYEKAEDELLKGIEVNPNFDLFYHWMGEVSSIKEEHERAIAYFDKAALLDPLNYFHVYFKGLQYVWQGKLGFAKNIYTEILNENSQNTQAMWFLAYVYIEEKNPQEAIDLLEQRELFHNPLLGYAYAQNGQLTQARSILAYLIDKSKTKYVPPSQIAWIYSGLGDEENTLGMVEESVRVGDGWFPSWGPNSIIFGPYWENPRFQEALKQVSYE
jgi:adenylate cyclase